MKQLLEDIKTGQFRQAYLLYGQEAYLRNQYRDRLKAAMVQEGDTMNFSSFQGKDINPAQIIDLAETMPFFADRRVILIQDSGWFKKGGEALADYLKTPSPTTFFIFAEAEADKRNRLFKAVKEAGCAVEFSTQDETTLKRWILGRIKKENKAISRSGLDFFLQKTGSDMENIDRELEKLFCYTLKKDAITEADIDAVKDKIMQADQVNESTEDSAVSAAPIADEVVDTVQYAESSKEEKGRTTVYTAKLSSSGHLLFTDGTESPYLPVYKDGTQELIGAKRDSSYAPNSAMSVWLPGAADSIVNLAKARTSTYSTSYGSQGKYSPLDNSKNAMTINRTL